MLCQNTVQIDEMLYVREYYYRQREASVCTLLLVRRNV